MGVASLSAYPSTYVGVTADPRRLRALLPSPALVSELTMAVLWTGEMLELGRQLSGPSRGALAPSVSARRAVRFQNPRPGICRPLVLRLRVANVQYLRPPPHQTSLLAHRAVSICALQGLLGSVPRVPHPRNSSCRASSSVANGGNTEVKPPAQTPVDVFFQSVCWHPTDQRKLHGPPRHVLSTPKSHPRGGCDPRGQ